MSMEATSDSFPPELTIKYRVSKLLEKGAWEKVRLGFRVPDVHRVAIKIICKQTIVTTFNGDSSSNVLNNIQILQSVIYLCIINLEDVIDTPNFLFIVLELPEGRELFNMVHNNIKKKLFAEASFFAEAPSNWSQTVNCNRKGKYRPDTTPTPSRSGDHPWILKCDGLDCTG